MGELGVLQLLTGVIGVKWFFEGQGHVWFFEGQGHVWFFEGQGHVWFLS